MILQQRLPQEPPLQNQVNSLNSSVSNGKTLVANAITGKGVATSPSDTFATMANNINKIETINTTASGLLSDFDIRGNVDTIYAGGHYSANDNEKITLISTTPMYLWQRGAYARPASISNILYGDGAQGRGKVRRIVIGAGGSANSYQFGITTLYSAVSSTTLTNAYGGLSFNSNPLFTVTSMNLISKTDMGNYYTFVYDLYLQLYTEQQFETDYDGTFTVSYSTTNPNDGAARPMRISFDLTGCGFSVEYRGGTIEYITIPVDEFFNKKIIS